ncbi:MFS transporter [Conexibacter sp. SYSU D00693]|uniref:MFS transporter n=1 Tax=Conexibacter sp. SYSU D00693 TaxID=2812560 RepID=UPI00196B41B1|nr:MFS transporter [Conexibacter sp. SYSU D00693]
MSQQAAAGLAPPSLAAPRASVGARSFAVASGAAFLAFLDATVANLAVADLRGDFAGASVGDATWVVTIYAIAFAALLAPAGRIADVLGRRTLLVAGVGGFTVFSLACAAAPSLGVLLAARGLQGAAAALMIPASLAVVLHDTPPERRTAAIGAWSAAGALAAAAGPALGGVLVDGFGWRAVFAITVPVGLAVLAAALRMRGGEGQGGRLADVLGSAVLGAGVGLAALGITQASGWGWGDGRTLACLAGAALAVAWSLRRSLGHPAPAIETSLWRSRSFAVANLASLLYGAALFSSLLVGVLVLVQVWGYSELEAGLAVTPGAVAAAIVALRAAPLVVRFGPRRVVAGGAAVLGTAFAVTVLTLPEDPAYLAFWLPVGLVMGVGMGALTTGISSAAALAVEPARFAAGVGLTQTGRQVGGALGVAGMATLLETGEGLGAYTDVYVMCALLALAAGLAGLGLAGAPKAARS